MQGVRRGAGWLHLTLAAAVVLAVCVQVYLIGAYVVGGEPGALTAHKDAGFVTHALEALVFINALVASLARVDLGVSFVRIVVGTAQIAFVHSMRWAGGLHQLFALFVLALAWVLV